MVQFSTNQNNIRSLVPQDVLLGDDSCKLAHFGNRELIVAHPMIEKTISMIEDAADPGLDQILVLLVGPTGVGKSALMRTLHARTLHAALLNMQGDLGLMPSIYVEADAPEEGNFNFGQFYRTSLRELGEPLVEHTLPRIERQMGDKVVITVAPEYYGKRPTVPALRARLQDSLIARKTRYYFVDEAVNIFHVRSARSKLDQQELFAKKANSVKSLVNKSSAVMILAGAYDFFNLTVSTGQLARRSQIVYFSEYTEKKDDIQGFTTAILALLAHLPAELDFDVETALTELLFQCAGCVGTARTILYRALKKALKAGKGKVTLKILKDSFYPKVALDVIQKEIAVGREQVLRHLELSDIKFKPQGHDERPIPPNTQSEQSEKRSQKLKPGQTAPSRRYKEPVPPSSE